MTKYLSPAQSAKVVRQALKEAFPGQKFSVRSKSYSGGGSISIHWTDGPATKSVEAVVLRFEGATFDGMTDYKGGRVHNLNGESVYFGSDFIFCHRGYSDEHIKKAIDLVGRKYHAPTVGITVERFRCGDLRDVSPLENARCEDYWSWQNRIHEIASKLTAILPKPSPIAENVTVERSF